MRSIDRRSSWMDVAQCPKGKHLKRFQSLEATSRPSSLSSILLNNDLPFPQNFNGFEFDSKPIYSRRNMPKYLQKDLPPLKYDYIGENFKQNSVIQCPRLIFFQKRIQRTRGQTEKAKKISQQSRNKYLKKPDKKAIHLKREIKQIKEQLKYALITMERDSNVVTDLVDKTHDLQQQLSYYHMRFTEYQEKSFNSTQRKTKSKKISHYEKKCFENTIQLLLNTRKDAELSKNTKENTVKYSDQKKKSLQQKNLIIHQDLKSGKLEVDKLEDVQKYLTVEDKINNIQLLSFVK